MNGSTSVMDDVAREWLAARDIIAKALSEFVGMYDQEQLQPWAAAILARLAHHEPPLVIGSSKTEVKMAVSVILDALPDMKPDERLELWSSLSEDYCTHCGSDELPCHCWNDE